MKYLEHSIKAEDTRYRDFTAEKDSYFQQSGIPFGFHSHPEQTGLGLGSILGLIDFRLYSEKIFWNLEKKSWYISLFMTHKL